MPNSSALHRWRRAPSATPESTCTHTNTLEAATRLDQLQHAVGAAVVVQVDAEPDDEVRG